jgi:hypothetical protein
VNVDIDPSNSTNSPRPSHGETPRPVKTSRSHYDVRKIHAASISGITGGTSSAQQRYQDDPVFINRAGENLPPELGKELEEAKRLLQENPGGQGLINGSAVCSPSSQSPTCSVETLARLRALREGEAPAEPRVGGSLGQLGSAGASPSRRDPLPAEDFNRASPTLKQWRRR